MDKTYKKRYNLSPLKPLTFVGSSRDDIRGFPRPVQRALGIELMRVQSGQEPVDFKSMGAVGPGAFEIRLHLDGAWRVIYVAKFAETIYVLHAFRKKTQRTSRSDLALATKRYNLVKAK